MKISKGWFIFGSLVTAIIAGIRIVAGNVGEKSPALVIVFALMDVYLFLSAVVAFVIFHAYRKSRWIPEQVKESNYSIESYSFANGVLTVWAVFLFVVMFCRFSN